MSPGPIRQRSGSVRRSSPSPATNSHSRPSIRSACEPCRNSKSKCPGERPICSRCHRLKKPCEYANPVLTDTAAYLNQLQAEVRELEQRKSLLAETEQPPAVNGNHRAEIPRPATTVAVASPVTALSPVPQNIPGQNVVPTPDGATSTYPKPHDRPLPSNNQFLFHLSSDPDVANILNDPVVQSAPPVPSRSNFLTTVDKSMLPETQQITQLVQHFCQYTLAAFPIFHVPTLQVWVEDVCFKDIQIESEVVCAVLLVLAVAATSLPSHHPMAYLKENASALWEYGQKFLPPVFLPPIDETKGLRRVQVMLIRLQYVLHHPSAGNVWGLSGAAVRASVDLGLQYESRETDHGHLSCVEVDLRRRVFWIAYSIDRDLSIALGRPPSISDVWINAEFPSDKDDSLITPDRILSGLPSASKLNTLHHFRIRRLQSQIQLKLYTPVVHGDPADFAWFTSTQQALDQWMATVPVGVGFCSREWLRLCYCMSQILLHRPSPGNPTPSRESLVKALEGSAQTMRLYKEMYRSGKLDFNWLSMYHLFIAGVTYLNSLWQAHRNGWIIVPSYVDALLDIQVCSGVMEALAAITPGTSGIRNTFETVSEKIIRQLTARARWDFGSRPSTPRAGQGNPTITLPMDTDNLDWNNLNNGGINPTFSIANPFDQFLLHPLGEMSTHDWERAVASVMGPFENNNDIVFP